MLVVWIVMTDQPLVRFLVRLYQDKYFLRDTVAAWGWAAPLVFMAIQALQVIISPIPGEVTGPVGGALFGTLWGVIYSTIGLTFGTLFCFWVGRMWGEPLIRPWLSEHHWEKMNFIHDRPAARYLDQLVLRRARRRAAVLLRGRLHRPGHRRLPAALLPSRADHRALPAQAARATLRRQGAGALAA
ncbi:MAG: TVP38/TMEM64 family protein [Candidatus Rokuibacteriota bacterium]|nr:MAG: TVP38/TMEM64 family protein [Candidatus Rokubacteria bacterium]